jgi:hypothetical protein
MATTRAKFSCNSITKRKHWNVKEHEFNFDAEFTAVSSGSEEDKKFFAATPSGSIKISTIISDTFEVGKMYYIDFIPCD